MVHATATAVYPTSIVADADIGLFTNVVTTTLTADVTDAATSFTVNSATDLSIGTFLSTRGANGYEIVRISAISGTTLTVVRAQDGTTAVAHSTGQSLRAVFHAKALNQLREEVQAVQTQLGITGAQNFLRIDGTNTMTGNLRATTTRLYDLGSTSLHWNVLHATSIGNVFNVRAYGAVGDNSTDDRTAINSAITAASAVNGAILIPSTTSYYRLASSLTVPVNVTTIIEGGGRFSTDAGTTLTILGPIVAPEREIFGGSGSYSLPRTETIYANWFGAVGDDSTNNATAVTNAIAAARGSNNASIVFSGGIYRFSTMVSATGSNAGISFRGPAFGALQQGSVNNHVVFKWTGGASAMFQFDSSYIKFYDISFQNFGTGTAALKWINGSAGRTVIDRCSFLTVSGSTNWSTAALDFTGLNYSQIRDCEFSGPAIKIRSISPGSNNTRNSIEHCTFDGEGSGAYIDCNGTCGIDFLIIRDCTYNTQSTASIHTFFDSSSVDASYAIYNLVFENMEVDSYSATTPVYLAKAKNVKNLVLRNVSFASLSNVTDNPVVVTNCVVVQEGTTGNSINKAIVRTTDTLSRVFVKPSNLDTANTRALMETASSSGLYIPVTIASSNAILHGNFGDPSAVTQYLITATDANPFTVLFSNPTDSTPGFMTKGQRFTVTVLNSSGGSMGAITWNASQFTLLSDFPNPANGLEASITFQYNGTKCVEVSRAVRHTSGQILYAGTNGGPTTESTLSWDETNNQLVLSATGSSAGIKIGGDALIYRSAADVLSLGADAFAINGTIVFTSGQEFAINLAPSTDDTYSVGSAAKRVGIFHGGEFHSRVAASDANPGMRIRHQGLEFGAGGASALDVALLRGGANRLDLASGDDLNLVSGNLQIGAVTVIDSSRNVFHTVIATGSLPAAGAAQDGKIIIEDAGAGDRNLIVYAGGQRFRIDGGAAF